MPPLITCKIQWVSHPWVEEPGTEEAGKQVAYTSFVRKSLFVDFIKTFYDWSIEHQ